MPDMLKDGTGTGNLARVGSDNRLRVYAKSGSVQHSVSEDSQQAYQLIGEVTATGADTERILHVTNNSSSKNLVVTYMRHQVVGGDATLPAKTDFFSVVVGSTVSGGSTVTPVNIYTGSGNTAEVTAVEDATSFTGGSTIDKWYTKAKGDMNTFNKEGALLVPPNQALHVSYTHTNTTEVRVYARISFIMED